MSAFRTVRLHIMGGVDDEEYAAECHALVDTLGVRDLIFTGRVDVVEYMEKLDFTILTSISEGQPLSVLESLAARRPCVTTEVGCCRELLEGAPGDDFGIAGFVCPPMYRKGLADAMERMCTSRARRIEMGGARPAPRGHVLPARADARQLPCALRRDGARVRSTQEGGVAHGWNRF